MAACSEARALYAVLNRDPNTLAIALADFTRDELCVFAGQLKELVDVIDARLDDMTSATEATP